MEYLSREKRATTNDAMKQFKLFSRLSGQQSGFLRPTKERAIYIYAICKGVKLLCTFVLYIASLISIACTCAWNAHTKRLVTSSN